MDRLEVARYSTLAEAELVVALLKRHGIDGRLADREMANSAPHLQIALGGLRVTAPDFQIVQAREVVAWAQAGVFSDETDGEDGWMAEATPGRVGELDDTEIHGVLGGMKSAAKLVVAAIFLLPVASCVVLSMLPEG